MKHTRAMKAALTTLLLATLLLTGACSLGGNKVVSPAPASTVPAAEAPAEMTRQGTATLYFRYLDEPYLAPESRVVNQTPSRPYEQVLINALLSGPTGHDLTALFPPGTRVISTARQGRTLFITFSQELMGAYADEPDTWASDPAWQAEVPLRRLLCMQGVAATITENCDVDRVQILVQQDTAAIGSLRLEKRYFMLGETGLADPIVRDDSLILTAENTLSVILALWQQKDWQRLYLYIARQDGGTGLDRPVYRDFIAAMDALPAMTQASFTGGSVSSDGSVTTFSLSARLRMPGGSDEDRPSRTIRLRREEGLWRVTMTQLTAWMEVSP
ncbi:MAG: GerMN domain-containing protein [Aristaeellaceae bacterium]